MYATTIFTYPQGWNCKFKIQWLFKICSLIHLFFAISNLFFYWTWSSDPCLAYNVTLQPSGLKVPWQIFYCCSSTHWERSLASWSYRVILRWIENVCIIYILLVKCPILCYLLLHSWPPPYKKVILALAGQHPS